MSGEEDGAGVVCRILGARSRALCSAHLSSCRGGGGEQVHGPPEPGVFVGPSPFPSSLILTVQRLPEVVYYFSRAAVAIYHKPGGLKQQKCMLSQFWRLKSEIRVLAGLVSSGASEGKSIPCHSS